MDTPSYLQLCSDTLIHYHTCPKIWMSILLPAVVSKKTVGWVANTVDPDQILYSVASNWVHIVWWDHLRSTLVVFFHTGSGTANMLHSYLGPVVQSVVSWTSSLRVISLTVLADSIYNILIFFAEKMWVAFALQKLLTFFQQTISAYLRIARLNF